MTDETPRLKYQPALDGLRAVAVLAVIAYHDDYSWAKGGFLGVDAFFVLSGFLITTLLVSEYQRSEAIRLLAFWGRRLRRLLPALLLVLAVVAVYGWLEVSPFELAQLRGDSLASLFYVTNWRFIAEGSSYFALVSSPSPVRHLWSLAIEEQFYLFWPLVVIACLRFGRGSKRVLVAVTVIGIVLSTVVMAALYDRADPSRAYYGTDARMHTMLVGALLALWLLKRRLLTGPTRRAVQVTGVLAAFVVLAALIGGSDHASGYYHGGSLLYAVAVAAVIAAVVQPDRGPVGAALALTPMIWIGRISYGLYLWHWPVNVYLTEARTGLVGNTLNLLRLGVTFVIAIGSYFLVEMPIRRGALRARPARWLAPAGVAVIAIAIVASTSGAEAIPGYLGGGAHWPIAECPAPSAEETAAATRAVQESGPRAEPTTADPVRVLIIGDSVACSFATGLGPAGEGRLDVRQIAMLGCGVVSDEVRDRAQPFPADSERCHDLVVDRERGAIKGFDPDVVVWMSTWERLNLIDHGKLLKTGSPGWRRVLQRRSDAAFDRLTSAGAHLVVTTAPAAAPSELLHGGRIGSTRFDHQFRTLNAQLRTFVARHRKKAVLADVATWVCPQGPPCPAEVSGVQPRRIDGNHYSPEGSVWLGRRLLPIIEAEHERGIVRPAAAISRSVSVASAGGSVADAMTP